MHDLRLVLGRFGHHLREFEPAGGLGGLDGLRSDGLDRREVIRAIREFHRAVWDYNDSLDWVQRLTQEPGDDENDAASSSRAATREYCGGRNVSAWQRAAAALPVILRAGEHLAIPVGDFKHAIADSPRSAEWLKGVERLVSEIESRLGAEGDDI